MRQNGNSGYYRPTYYQLYVAADLAHAITASLSGHEMTLGAGQGKTPVFLILMMMLNKLEAQKYKNFLVITISDILKIQLEDIIRRHRLPFDVDVHTGDDFDKILD